MFKKLFSNHSNHLIIHKTYEMIDEERIQTYMFMLEEETYYLLKDQVFYHSILGDKIIEKLIGKGYIPLEELKKKYNLENTNIKIKAKKRNLW